MWFALSKLPENGAAMLFLWTGRVLTWRPFIAYGVAFIMPTKDVHDPHSFLRPAPIAIKCIMFEARVIRLITRQVYVHCSWFWYYYVVEFYFRISLLVASARCGFRRGFRGNGRFVNDWESFALLTVFHFTKADGINFNSTPTESTSARDKWSSRNIVRVTPQKPFNDCEFLIFAGMFAGGIDIIQLNRRALTIYTLICWIDYCMRAFIPRPQRQGVTNAVTFVAIKFVVRCLSSISTYGCRWCFGVFVYLELRITKWFSNPDDIWL